MIRCQNTLVGRPISTYPLLTCLLYYKLEENMSEAYKLTYKEDKLADTSDDFYPTPIKHDYAKTTVNGLVVCLNSKKTQLRSHQIQQDSINQKLNELDMQANQLTIANDFLSKQADAITLKQTQALQQKKEMMSELNDWKDACACLKTEAGLSEEELRRKRGYICGLAVKEQQLRGQIKERESQNKGIQDYNLGMDLMIGNNDNSISKLRSHKDSLSTTATTLQTFAKSFRKNINQTQKDLSRAKFETGQLQNAIVTKQFEKSNITKEIDERNWQSNMYKHHNLEIEQTNLKLKGDLDKLLLHLESLRKNNGYLNGCMQAYSATGIETAKKILAQANK